MRRAVWACVGAVVCAGVGVGQESAPSWEVEGRVLSEVLLEASEQAGVSLVIEQEELEGLSERRVSARFGELGGVEVVRAVLEVTGLRYSLESVEGGWIAVVRGDPEASLREAQLELERLEVARRTLEASRALERARLQRPEATELVVGVVDWRALGAGADAWVQAALQSIAERQSEELQGYRERLDGLREQLEGLVENTEAWFRARAEYGAAVRELESVRARWEERLERGRREARQRWEEAVEGAIERFARERGYTLILRSDEEGVCFAGAGVDVTAEVLGYVE